MEQNNLRKLFNDLETIKETINEIKLSMANSDCFLTQSDLSAIKAYQNEKEKGKLISQDELKRQLGL